MEPFVLASGNADKAAEIAEVFADATGTEVVALVIESRAGLIGFAVGEREAAAAVVDRLPHVGVAPDVEETGATLEENARIKASAVASALRATAVADDTGLEVDALAGAPGVHAARFAGPRATYADNVNKLLTELAGVDASDRTARFATVALAWFVDGAEVAARGEVEGRITDAPRGDGGFGYDPVFAPVEGDGRTFAEMARHEKHAISHRGRAFRALAARLAGA